MRYNGYPILNADQVACQIRNGDTVAFSGFTPAGGAKAVPRILADHAQNEHASGRDYRIRVLTGASSGD